MAGITPYTDESWRKTNADRIRSRSDEELAKWIVNIAIQCTAVGGKSDYLTNETWWLNWLKEEVVV